MPNPNYLLQKPSGYYFRYQLPPDIKAITEQSELRYSLQTRSVGLARSKARLLAGTVQNTIRNIRHGHMPELSDAQVTDLLKAHLRHTLETDAQEQLRMPPADHALQQHLKVGRHNSRITQRHQKKACSNDLSSIDMVASEPSNTPSMRLSELMQRYFEEGERQGSWSTEKSREEVESDLKLNLRITGDIPVNTFGHIVANQLKDTLMKLPPRINSSPRYRDKTIDALLDMDHPKLRSIRTINKGLHRMGAVLKYGVRHGYVEKNPMEGLTLKEKKSKQDKREDFNTADLQKIFGSVQYQKDTFRTAYNFWMPVLALYTGARITELAQLHLDDFKQVDGIWCIDINDDADDKKLKTQAAKRLVPLHPFLVDDLGLIKRIESIKTQGHSRLFPDIARTRDGYGQTVSKWFGYYRKTIGITAPDKVFHSFRHTAISKLAHTGVDDHIIKALVGHAENTVTYSTYVKDYPVTAMFEAIVGALMYDVDLSHLMNSKYCGGRNDAGGPTFLTP